MPKSQKSCVRHPSILRNRRIWGAADDAVLNKVPKILKNLLFNYNRLTLWQTWIFGSHSHSAGTTLLLKAAEIAINGYNYIRVAWIRIFGEAGSGSALEWKAGSDSAWKSESRSCRAQNGAVEGRERSQWRRGGSKWSRGQPETSGRRFSALKSKIRNFKAQNGAIKGRERSQWRRGGSKWSRGRPVDRWSQIRIPLISRIQIRFSDSH